MEVTMTIVLQPAGTTIYKDKNVSSITYTDLKGLNVKYSLK
jgi:hypothetical protein